MFIKNQTSKNKHLALILLVCISLTACNLPSKLPSTPTSISSEVTRTAVLPSATAPIAVITATIPAATATPSVTPCGLDAGQLESINLPSEYLADGLTAQIYTPPCYNPAAGEAYPVLYMLHGQTYDAGQWPRLGLTDAADQFIGSGEIQPLIMVFPLEVNTFADTGVSGFDKALVNELIPWVDANYTTCVERACRAIGGLSRGSAWAFMIGMKNWHLFGSIAMHSPTPFYETSASLPTWLASIPKGEQPRLRLDWGKYDYYRSLAAKLDERLTELNVPHETVINDGQHDEKYWSAHVEEYLRWYAAGFTAEE